MIGKVAEKRRAPEDVLVLKNYSLCKIMLTPELPLSLLYMFSCDLLYEGK